VSHTSPGMHDLHLSRVVPGSFTCKGKAFIGIGGIQASAPRTTFAKILRDIALFPPTNFTLLKIFLLPVYLYFVLNHAVYGTARNLEIIS